MDNYAHVQFWAGNDWRTVENVPPTPQFWRPALEQAARNYPDTRVRVVDEDNRLLDML